MSLHDILMQRAAIQAQNDFMPSNLEALALQAAQTASDVIVQKQAEKKAKRDREEAIASGVETAKKINTTNKGKLIAKYSEKSGLSVEPSSETSGTKGIYVTDPVGKKISKIGDVPENAVVQKGFITPEFAAEKTRATKEVGREFEAEAFIRDAQNIQSDLTDVFNDFLAVPDALKGPLEGSTSGQVQAFLQTDAGVPLRLYQESLDFFLSNVARSLGGERGVLTDRDIERIKGLMPNALDKQAVATGKIERVKRFIDRRIESRRKEILEKDSNESPDGLSDEDAYEEYLKIIGGK